MTLIIIGNIFSFGSAVFTGLSSWTRKTDKVYIYQTYQCILLAIASVFFQSWAGIATLILCAVRNMLTAKGKLNLKISVLMIAVLVFIGLFINNRGAVGWIVTGATILYTIGAYVFHSELMIKINILVNLILWIIYDFIIWDFSSMIMDSVILVITVAAIIRAVILKSSPV